MEEAGYVRGHVVSYRLLGNQWSFRDPHKGRRPKPRDWTKCLNSVIGKDLWKVKRWLPIYMAIERDEEPVRTTAFRDDTGLKFLVTNKKAGYAIDTIDSMPELYYEAGWVGINWDIKKQRMRLAKECEVTYFPWRMAHEVTRLGDEVD
jgi:hypothetical protein